MLAIDIITVKCLLLKLEHAVALFLSPLCLRCCRSVSFLAMLVAL
jgi:hypothetical protein